MKTVGYLDKIRDKALDVRQLVSKVKDVEFRELAFDKHIIPHKTDTVVVHGVLRGNDTIIQQATAKNIDWVTLDNAYLGKYKRVIKNATAPITFRKGRRFEHNTKLEPWRGGEGKHVLVLPPSYPYMDTFGLRDFLNYIAHHANLYTDKPLVMRGKPAKGRKAPPLQEQLRDSAAVITWGSAVALEACRLGVPTISLGWCPGKLCSFNLDDLETNRLNEEPPRMEMFDNLTWSNFDREELPYAWDIVEENSQMTKINEIRA